MIRWLLWGLAASCGLAWLGSRQKSESKIESEVDHESVLQKRQDLAHGFDLTRTRAADGTTHYRFRGSYQDIMQTLNPKARADQPPPLPADLDVEALSAYRCGCPHCGKSSVYGESIWRYHEISRTRGSYDNTTTYLAGCKKCQGLMRATVDHDD